MTTMTMYNAHIELDHRPVDPDYAEQLLEPLGPYHPAVGQTPRGYLSIRLSFPAENLRQAIASAMTIAEGHTFAEAIGLEVMTEAEWLAREGAADPDVLSVQEAADLLDKSRARVNQMIDEGKFPSAHKIGKRWVIARRDVEVQLTIARGAGAVARALQTIGDVPIGAVARAKQELQEDDRSRLEP